MEPGVYRALQESGRGKGAQDTSKSSVRPVLLAVDALDNVQPPAGETPLAPAVEGLNNKEKQQQEEEYQLLLERAIQQVCIDCHACCCDVTTGPLVVADLQSVLVG